MTFKWHTPSRLEEAHALLDKHGDGANLIAGGTGLVVMMKQRLVQPEHLVSLYGISDLHGIQLQDGHLRLGAVATHRQVETSDLVRERAPLLAEAFGHVATVRIREMATVGGGLAQADPAEDTPPALMALDASVRLTSSQGDRTVPLKGFFEDYYTTVMEPQEVLADVLVPLPSPGARFAFKKFLPRTADDYGTAIVAVVLDLDANSMCRHVRVALGSAGPGAPSAPTARRRYCWANRSPREAIREAAEAVKSEVDPIEDIRGSADYKREMAAVFTKRALEEAVAG